MSTTDDRRANLAKWIEKYEPRSTPGVLSIFNPPTFVPETTTERIEPYATEYDRLAWEHPYLKDCDCAEPDPEWYTPTPKLRRLEKRLDALRAKAFRTVPNPDYDPERAAAYWEQQRRRFDQPRIEVGQSYTPALKDS